MQAEAARLNEWCRYRLPGLHLVTDLAPAEALSLAQDISRLGSVAEPWLPGAPAAADLAPLEVLAFARRGDFRRLTGSPQAAGYMDPSARANRLLVGPRDGSLREVALHEYAHYLLRRRLEVSLPVWFDEGLASLFGAVRFEDGTAVLGELPVRRMEPLLDERAMPAATLRSAIAADDLSRWSGRRVSDFYDLSWLTVHYLLFGEALHGEGGASGFPADLAGFLAVRDAGLMEHLGTTHAGLVRALEEHLRRLPPPRQVPSPAVEVHATSGECLSEGARDLLLADAVSGLNPKLATRMLEPLLAREPEDPAVLVALSRAEEENDPARASALAAKARDLALGQGTAAQFADATIQLANLRVAGCLLRTDEQCAPRWARAAALYREALRRDPTRQDGVLGLGLALLYTGQAGQAVNYLRVAYGNAPWSPPVNLFLGEAFRITGDTRAWRHLANARNWSEKKVWQVLAARSLAALAGN